VRKKRPGS
jgi:hypothetical protein